MMRSCKERSRSYPGRPARRAVQLTLDSVLCGNIKDDGAGVSRGHSSSPMRNEGPNPEKGSVTRTRGQTRGVDSVGRYFGINNYSTVSRVVERGKSRKVKDKSVQKTIVEIGKKISKSQKLTCPLV